MNFGVLEAPVDDPPLRRQDLTGLHVRCTTVEVGSVVLGGVLDWRNCFFLMKLIKKSIHTSEKKVHGYIILSVVVNI